MPAWTSTPCWCSAISTSTTSSSSPSRRSLGEIEQAIGTSLRRPSEYRLPTTFADVSNLDKDNKPFARDDRRRLFAIGNRLWHSDSSFKATPAKYSLLHARQHPVQGRQHRVRRHARGLRRARRRDQGRCARTWCASTRRSIRASSIGFFDLTDEERERFKPVLPGAGPHPSGDGPQVALPVLACRRHRRLAGARGARLPARPDRARDAARVRLFAQMAASAIW